MDRRRRTGEDAMNAKSSTPAWMANDIESMLIGLGHKRCTTCKCVMSYEDMEVLDRACKELHEHFAASCRNHWPADFAWKFEIWADEAVKEAKAWAKKNPLSI
jgi:hypothetical protein